VADAGGCHSLSGRVSRLLKGEGRDNLVVELATTYPDRIDESTNWCLQQSLFSSPEASDLLHDATGYERSSHGKYRPTDGREETLDDSEMVMREFKRICGSASDWDPPL
jgi:hypothetical protein